MRIAKFCRGFYTFSSDHIKVSKVCETSWVRGRSAQIIETHWRAQWRYLPTANSLGEITLELWDIGWEKLSIGASQSFLHITQESYQRNIATAVLNILCDRCRSNCVFCIVHSPKNIHLYFDAMPWGIFDENFLLHNLSLSLFYLLTPIRWYFFDWTHYIIQWFDRKKKDD